jgi:hypothetical protein
MRVAAAVAATGLALVWLGAAAAADGGSGTYTATGQAYAFNLANSGTTAWQYFYLVGPPGTSFVGGATAGEITVHCAAGQPDGQANEIECGPISAAGLAPSGHIVFVATVGAPAVCGAAFQVDVSPTGSTPFTRVADATPAGACAGTPPAVVAPPTLRGATTVGSRLTASAPTWSEPPARVSYQWQLCASTGCRPIKGATALTLELTKRDAGHSVRLVAAATIEGVNLTTMSKKLAIRLRR